MITFANVITTSLLYYNISVINVSYTGWVNTYYVLQYIVLIITISIYNV